MKKKKEEEEKFGVFTLKKVWKRFPKYKLRNCRRPLIYFTTNSEQHFVVFVYCRKNYTSLIFTAPFFLDSFFILLCVATYTDLFFFFKSSNQHLHLELSRGKKREKKKKCSVMKVPVDR